MAKVNIIVPVYNVSRYLPTFLDSVLKQTYTDFDLWIVDDCSTDNSLEILQYYCKKYSDKMHIIENEKNMGLCMTRNKGMDACEKKGVYLLLLDSDDYLELNYLERMVANAEKYQADITICGLERFDDNSGNVVCREMIQNPEEVITQVSNCEILGYMNPVVWNKMFRWDVVSDCRFTSIKRSEDTIFLFTIMPRVKRIKFINDVLYHYRIREDSLSGAITDDKYKSMLIGFAKTSAFYKKSLEYEPFMDLFVLQMYIRCGMGGACRMAFQNLKKTNYYTKHTYDFLNKEFPQWYKNKYLSLRGFWRKKKYAKAVSVTVIMYRLHVFPLFVFLYWFASVVCKKDIRA